jgi:hypothetical protein
MAGCQLSVPAWQLAMPSDLCLKHCFRGAKAKAVYRAGVLELHYAGLLKGLPCQQPPGPQAAIGAHRGSDTDDPEQLPEPQYPASYDPQLNQGFQAPEDKPPLWWVERFEARRAKVEGIGQDDRSMSGTPDPATAGAQIKFNTSSMAEVASTNQWTTDNESHDQTEFAANGNATGKAAEHPGGATEPMDRHRAFKAVKGSGAPETFQDHSATAGPRPKRRQGPHSAVVRGPLGANRTVQVITQVGNSRACSLRLLAALTSELAWVFEVSRPTGVHAPHPV